MACVELYVWLLRNFVVNVIVPWFFLLRVRFGSGLMVLLHGADCPCLNEFYPPLDVYERWAPLLEVLIAPFWI